MDEQPSTPSWLTIDLTIIALSAIVIAIGIWMSLWRPTARLQGLRSVAAISETAILAENSAIE
jgi:hypothetical protein